MRVAPAWVPVRAKRGPYTGRGASLHPLQPEQSNGYQAGRVTGPAFSCHVTGQAPWPECPSGS